MTSLTIAETASLLQEKDNIMVLTHIRPDGDTIGSAGALCYALRKLGKSAYLYNNPQFSDAYPWISDPYIAPKDFVPQFTVSVDLADTTLFPKGYEGKPDLCIDHHPSNTFYAEKTLVLPEKSSCGEIMQELVKKLIGRLDPKVADLLYVAISTDTGCFCYGNTTGDTLFSAAELCKAGASNAYLNKILFRTCSRERLALEALIISSLRYYSEGKTVIAMITKEMLKATGATEKDCQDMAGLPGRVEGALCSALIKESEDNSVKISLRSTGVVSATNICAQFGGGGHLMASGCAMENKTCDEAADILAAAIDKEYK